MNPWRPSRRNVLGGLFAGLLGWLLGQRSKPPTQATPAREPAAAVCDRRATLVTSTYDANGNCIHVAYEYGGATRLHATTDALGRTTALTYKRS